MLKKIDWSGMGSGVIAAFLLSTDGYVAPLFVWMIGVFALIIAGMAAYYITNSTPKMAKFGKFTLLPMGLPLLAYAIFALTGVPSAIPSVIFSLLTIAVVIIQITLMSKRQLQA